MHRHPFQFGTRAGIAFVALCAIGVRWFAPAFRDDEPPATVDRIGQKEATQVVSQLLRPDEPATSLIASGEKHGWRLTALSGDRPVFEVFGRDRQGQTVVIKHPGGLYRMIPSSYDVVVSLADKSGAILTTSGFSLGWRVYEANSRTVRRRGRTMVVFEERSYRQYYAFVENRPVLVRLEDLQKTILRNTFGAPNLSIGPPSPQRSAEEWEAALESADEAAVLRSLVWLGGRHVDPDLQPPLDSYREPLEAAQVVQETRNRPRVQQTLNRLLGSGDRWLQEAAALALSPEYYR